MHLYAFLISFCFFGMENHMQDDLILGCATNAPNTRKPFMNSLDIVVDSEPDQSGSGQNTPAPRFVVGRGRKGGWIVNDRLGLVGGIFISESAARHFAIEESDRHPERVLLASADAEIDFPLSQAA